MGAFLGARDRNADGRIGLNHARVRERRRRLEAARRRRQAHLDRDHVVVRVAGSKGRVMVFAAVLVVVRGQGIRVVLVRRRTVVVPRVRVSGVCVDVQRRHCRRGSDEHGREQDRQAPSHWTECT
jgi:hypothetical protein